MEKDPSSKAVFFQALTCASAPPFRMVPPIRSIMRIALVGDLHFISPEDPPQARRERRRHFALAWPSFARTVALLRAAMEGSARNILATHVPLNTPEMAK